jgi:hypothetical protein
MGVFIDFHAHSKFVKSLNASFIALIPKSPGGIELANFWPISLMSGVYKIIASNIGKYLLDQRPQPHTMSFSSNENSSPIRTSGRVWLQV